MRQAAISGVALWLLLAAATPAAAETAKGTVLRVEAAARKFEFRTEADQTVACVLKPDAKLFFRGQPIALGEVRFGDKVEVEFERVAAEIRVSKLTVTLRPMRAMADTPAPTRPPSMPAPPGSTSSAGPELLTDAGAYWRQKAYYATDRKPIAALGTPFPVAPFLLFSAVLGGGGLLAVLFGFGEARKRWRRWGGFSLLLAATIAGMATFSWWWQGPASNLAVGTTFGKERSDELRYGYGWVSIPKIHKPGAHERPSLLRLEFKPDPAKHIALLESENLKREPWLAELRASVAKSAKKEVFIFIHGYNVGFEDALRRTAQLAFDLKLDGPAVLFSWPSQAGVVPYTVDENYADLATDRFQSVLQDVANETGAATVHLLAHSMGNRVLAETLSRFMDQRAEWLPRKLGEIVMAAPDVDRDKFRSRYHPLLKGACRRLTLYASANDRALQASRVVHGNPRAGDAGRGLLILEKMDSIDVTKVDTSFLGHSYYGDEPELIQDLRGILEGSSVGERQWLIRLLMENLPYWEMKGKGGG